MMKNDKKLYILSVVLGGLALFSREEAIVLPIIIFLILFLNPIRNVKILSKHILLKSLIITLPYFLISGLGILYKWHTLSPVFVKSYFTLNPLIVLKNIGYFAVNLMVPIRVIFDFVGYKYFIDLRLLIQKTYPYWPLALFVLIPVLFAWRSSAKLLRKSPLILRIGFGFFIVSLLPYLFLNGNGLRFVYIPSLGFSLILAYCFLGFFKKRRVKYLQSGSYSLIVFLILFLNFVALQERSYWWKRSSDTTQSVLTQAGDLLDLQSKEEVVYFANLPRRLHGAYIFHSGFSEAIELFYPDFKGKVRDLGEIDVKNFKNSKGKKIFTYKDHKFSRFQLDTNSTRF